MYYTENFESLREKKFDLENVNLSDYSVQMTITDTMKKNFKQYLKDHPNQDKTLIQMIKEKLDEEISKCPKVLEENKDGNTSVVDVTIAYDNSDMYKLLEKRGAILASGKFS